MCDSLFNWTHKMLRIFPSYREAGHACVRRLRTSRDKRSRMDCKQCRVIVCLQQAARFIRTPKFLQRQPLADLPEWLWLVQTWSTCRAIPPLWVCVKQASFFPHSFMPFSTLLVTVMTKASSSVSYVQSAPWGIQMAFSPLMHDSCTLSLSRQIFLSLCHEIFSKQGPDAKMFFLLSSSHSRQIDSWELTVSILVFRMHIFPHLAVRGDKVPTPSIKHQSSCFKWDLWTTAWAESHLLSCWYHSNNSLAKINEMFWKAFYWDVWHMEDGNGLSYQCNRYLNAELG